MGDWFHWPLEHWRGLQNMQLEQRENADGGGCRMGRQRGFPFPQKAGIILLTKVRFLGQLRRRKCQAIRVVAIWIMNSITRSDFKPHSLLLEVFLPIWRAGFHQFSCLIPASCQAAAVFKKTLGSSFESFKNLSVQLASFWIPSDGWLNMGPKSFLWVGLILGWGNLIFWVLRNKNNVLTAPLLENLEIALF